MPEYRESRQSRSAGHYLVPESIAWRLQPTLVLAARALGFPSARVTILDDSTQHTIRGLGSYAVAIPRNESLCDVVVSTGTPLSVGDAQVDRRFAAFPSVVDGSVGTYVGVPLIGRESLPVGAVCVISPDVLPVEDDAVARLTEFGKIVEDQLELMRRLTEQRQQGQVATSQLAEAIIGGEIVPWYQPIVELSTGRTRGYEALARWVHPSGDVDPPNNFVPLAEDTDLIIDLDLSIMRQALADLHRWQVSAPTLRMSTNLSVRHFDQKDWIVPILAAAADAGVRPDSVDLELTETSQLSAATSDGAFVKELQALGFRVWLDDFGTGWSAMDYLLRMPADGVKIDRAISVALGTHVGNALTRSLTTLADELGLGTTIEGIETAENAILARDLGCRFGQGYLWSAPVPALHIDRIWAHHESALPAAHTETDPPTAKSHAPEDSPLKSAVTHGPDHPSSEPARPRTGNSHSNDIWEQHPRGPQIDGSLAVSVLDAIPDATAVLDGTGTIVAVNHAWRMFSLDNGGSEHTNGAGVSYLEVCERAAERGSVDAAVVASDLRTVLDGDLAEAEMEYPCPSPVLRRWFLLRISQLRGEVTGVVVSHVNITRRKMAEEELSHLAMDDPLTGLANSTLLRARLTKTLSPRKHQRPTADIGVLYIDLDDFKRINDTFGHNAGDEVLQIAAHRLRELTRPQDTVGRLGGDEFAVVAPRVDPSGLAALASRASEALARPHHLHGQEVQIGGSVGAYLATAGQDAAEVLHRADEAMYSVKELRKSGLR